MKQLRATPSLPIAPVESWSFDTDGVRPFSNRSSDAAMRDMNICSAVVGLIFWQGPAAILWAIAFLIIDAVDRVLGRWTRTHISKEVFKGEPSIAHCNATSKIVFEVLAVRVRAAVNYAGPYAIFGRMCSAMSTLRYLVSVNQLIAMNAAARRCFSTFQILCPSGFFASAVAFANPHGTALRVVEGSAMQRCEKAKSLAGKVDWFSHKHSLLRGAIAKAHLSGSAV